MIRTKYLFLAIVFSILLYACGDNKTTTVANFDHAAQAVKDNDSLVSFFKKHYYDANDSLVKPLVAGQVSLANDPNLKNKSVTEQDVDYILYYYVAREGGRDGNNNVINDKGKPTVVDSVLVKYNGKMIVNTDSISNSFDAKTTWLTLDRVIRGWTHGFVEYKGGKNTSGNNPDDPINYLNSGKGVLFIPSGLGYRNTGNIGIPGNRILIFYINLFDIVKNTDYDSDGIPSIQEDLDGDGDPRNDDTDGDRISNYLDSDDDGDGKPTKDEDRDGDGDPRNDFNDPNNPTLADYLNPNIFG